MDRLDNCDVIQLAMHRRLATLEYALPDYSVFTHVYITRCRNEDRPQGDCVPSAVSVSCAALNFIAHLTLSIEGAPPVQGASKDGLLSTTSPLVDTH